MATAEAVPASLGPRYAPEDPTLPKPWMGLIDGSTSLLYYWNPETNVTQYEKPVSLRPLLPPGPPPPPSTPKLAQIPVAHSVHPNGLVAQTTKQGQQISQLSQQGQATQQFPQATQQQGQQSSQLPLQHGQLGPQQQGLPMAQVSNQQVAQQQGSQMPQGMQQTGQLTAQIMQHPGQQVVSRIGQQMSQQEGQQLLQQPMQQQTIQRMPQQGGQHLQQQPNLQIPLAHGQQYSYQHYITYQQNMLPQNQQSPKHQFPAFPRRGDVDFKQGNQTSLSPSHFQQAVAPSSQNLPTKGNSVSMLTVGGNSVSTPQAGAHGGQPQQFSGSAATILAQFQQTGTDLVQQQAPRFQNHVGPSVMHHQQSNMPTVHGRTSNDYYINSKMEGSVVGLGQSNLTPIPMGRNKQESRMGGVPFQNVTTGYTGGFNSACHTMQNMYNHATGGPPFPNNALMSPSFVGSSDVSHLSPAEVYCQEHEVTATGDNVPPPFMTFEATGFPPEILRDVRYLLQTRSKCRTLLCYWQTYICNNYSDFWRLQNGQLEPFLCIFYKGGLPFVQITPGVTGISCLLAPLHMAILPILVASSCFYACCWVLVSYSNPDTNLANCIAKSGYSGNCKNRFW